MCPFAIWKSNWSHLRRAKRSIVLSLRALPTWETGLSPLLCLWRKRRARRSRGMYVKKCNRGFRTLRFKFRNDGRWKNQRRALSPSVVPSTRYLPTDLINVTRNIELYILHLKFLAADGAYSHFKTYNHTSRIYAYRNLIVSHLIFLKSRISNLYQDRSRIEYAVWVGMQFQRDIKETYDRSICSYFSLLHFERYASTLRSARIIRGNWF